MIRTAGDSTGTLNCTLDESGGTSREKGGTSFVEAGGTSREKGGTSFGTSFVESVGTLAEASVQRCEELPAGALHALLDRFDLELGEISAGAEIPGSHWGAPEAGLVGRTVFVRGDTPVHSALHEAGHLICMDPARRQELDTDAGGDDLEESAVCVLQILLADLLPDTSSARLMRDMDSWGYGFRLGSTRAWLERDAEDAFAWLAEHGLIDPEGELVFRLRGADGSPRNPRTTE